MMVPGKKDRWVHMHHKGHHKVQLSACMIGLRASIPCLGITRCCSEKATARPSKVFITVMQPQQLAHLKSLDPQTSPQLNCRSQVPRPEMLSNAACSLPCLMDRSIHTCVSEHRRTMKRKGCK